MAQYPIYRLVKGDQLTFTEMDDNLRWLSQNMSGSQLTLTGSTISMTGSVIIDGDVFIHGTASIGFLKTIAFSSGSNQLGNDTLDVQTLIGTVNISGSLNVSGSTYIPDLTGSLFGTASWALNSLTASFAINAISASYVSGSAAIITNLTSSNDARINGANIGTKSTTSIIFGTFSGNSVTTAGNGVYIGYNAGPAITTGNGNTLVGFYAGRVLNTGYFNTIIGVSAGYDITSGYYNTFIGKQAGYGITTGNNNIIISSRVTGGTGITTGSYNTIIGDEVGGLSSTLSNNIILSDGQGNIKYRWDATQNNIYGNLAVTGSVTATLGFTGSLFGTASWALNALSSSQANSASYAYTASSAVNSFNAITASHALTASSADNFLVRQSVTASNALITGNITAQTLVVQTITSSVIYSSGSNTFGNELTNLQIFTGSVRITGSLNVKDIPQGNYANVVLLDTASGNFYVTASTALNITSVVATKGSTLYSLNPLAATSANQNNSIFLGFSAGNNATNANDSIFLGRYAGNNATNAYVSNFFGPYAGDDATNAGYSNFLGTSAGNTATNAENSNFLGNSAGSAATSASYSNFLGAQAGSSARSASYSTLIGYRAGANLLSISSDGIASNNIIIGTNITLAENRRDSINLGSIIFATGSYSTTAGNPFSGSIGNGRVGINQPLPEFSLDVSGSGRYTNGLDVTGSLKIKDVAQGNYINVLLLDTASGQVYITASTALSAASVIAVTGDTNLYSLFPKASVPGASSENSIYIGSGSGTGIADYNSINSVIIGFEAGGGTSNSDAQNSTWIGYQAGYNADYAERSILIGYQAGASDGQNGPELNDAVFLGYQAGYSASFAYASNFLGYRAGMYAESADQSNFLGYYAGYSASDASDSNFLGSNSGFAASLADDSNFLGSSAGAYSRYAEYSNFFGFRAGFQAYSASYSTLIGYKAGDNDTIFQGIGSNNIIVGTNITLQEGRKDSINIGGILFGTGSFADPGAMFASSDPVLDGKIGINKSIPAYNLDVSGSGNFTKGLDVTGSLKAPDITGSLFGTSSWARNSVTSSNFNGTGSNGFVSNMGDTYTGTAKITDIMTLNQTEYNAIGSPSTNTLYIIL